MSNLDPKKVIAYLANTKVTDNESKVKAVRLVESLITGEDEHSKRFSKRLFESIELLAAEDLKIVESGSSPAPIKQINEAIAIKGKLIEIADNLLM
jgi:hypothetical protein